MSLLFFILLAILFLPVYLVSWIVYGTYTFGVLEVFPHLISVTQPQVFLICVFVLLVGSMIKTLFIQEHNFTDYTITLFTK